MLFLQVSYVFVEALDTCLPHLLEGSPPQPSFFFIYIVVDFVIH